MANPYAFGQKDYSTLDRRRQMIDDAMRGSFETSNSIEQMRQRKEQQDRIKAIATTYQAAMQDPSLLPEQKADIQAKAATEFAGIGAPENAKTAIGIADVYSRMHQPKAEKSIDVYLGTRRLPGGGRGLHYGIPASGTSPEVVHKVDQLTDKTGDGSGKGKTDEELKAAARIEDLSKIAVQAGTDLKALDSQTYKDATGNVIIPTSPEGIAQRTKIEATMRNAQDQINQVQAIMSDKYGWKITTPEGRTVTPQQAREVNYPKKQTSSVQASQAAINYYNANKNNPQIVSMFKQKYGYLP